MRTLLVLFVLIAAAESPAAVVDVFPGPGTPLQDAIDAASPGDMLNVHAGTYNESITITKSLQLHGRDGDVVIAAGCVASAALTVAADDVRIRGAISQSDLQNGGFVRVDGGTTSVVDVQNHDRVTMKNDLIVRATCAGVQHGFNIVNSTNVRIRNASADGTNSFTVAAIRIAAIPVGGRVNLSRTTWPSAARGIFIENCPLGSGIRITLSGVGKSYPGNEVVTDGIVLENSDGVSITRSMSLGS